MIQCLIKKILFSKHLLTIYSFICFIIFILFIGIISSNIRYASFAISPSFVRQEIQDGHKDLLEIDDSNYTITKVNVTDINKKIFNTIDIDRVSYFSDAKFLNATIWLSPPYLSNQFLSRPLDFGILVDVNPNPAIGVGGVNYHKEISYPPPMDLPNKTKSVWSENTHEALSYGPHRYLKPFEHNYNYTQLIQHGTFYLPLSLDLSTLNFPEQYKVMFYTLSADKEGNRILDITSWIDIPPPKFNFSSSSNSIIEIRPGETKNIGLILKSSFGSLPPKVNSFTTIGNQTGIKVFSSEDKFDDSTNSLKPTQFNIVISSDTQPGEYIIPIKANISSGSPIASEFLGAINYGSYIQPESSFNTVADSSIRVLEPLTFTQWFKEGWDTYGSIISLVGGGFTAGLATLVFDRLKNKRK
jgi:hypothetical protein